eukprot:SAG31_NODE_9372_length_1289_cov_1.057143_1_plen_220_part_00
MYANKCVTHTWTWPAPKGEDLEFTDEQLKRVQKSHDTFQLQVLAIAVDTAAHDVASTKVAKTQIRNDLIAEIKPLLQGSTRSGSCQWDQLLARLHGVDQIFCSQHTRVAYGLRVYYTVYTPKGASRVGFWLPTRHFDSKLCSFAAPDSCSVACAVALYQLTQDCGTQSDPGKLNADVLGSTKATSLVAFERQCERIVDVRAPRILTALQDAHCPDACGG